MLAQKTLFSGKEHPSVIVDSFCGYANLNTILRKLLNQGQ